MSDLAGITVVAVEQAVAAPYASSRLADAGARVIKVERPAGDFARGYDRFVLGQSAYFVWLNRGKESICLDLRRAEDRELLERMIARADVYLHNLKPGTLSRMGLGSEHARERNPQLITCEITGFGSHGPRSSLKAYDLIVQGEVGLCSITGGHSAPARVGVSVADIAAGMTAHSAILLALLGRHRTGRGRAIQVSLFDSLADWMNVPLLQYLYGGHVVERGGVAHPTIAPYGVYACRDNAQIILSVQNDREWVSFCEHFLRQPQLVRDERFHDNPARLVHRRTIDTIVGETFSHLGAEEAAERLQLAGVAHGRLNTLAEAAAHPHLRFISIETPAGEVRVIAPAAIADVASHFGAVPAPGEHTERLKVEFSSSS